MYPSPIVLFVYNRLDHTVRTVEALLDNELANQSDLFVYSDGARTSQVESQVSAVRDYVRNITGFKSLTVIEREANLGLAKNIIDGVTSVVRKYGRVIVLEDDIVTSPAFLTFMNQALDCYHDDSKVWHISGWNYPIDTDALGDVFLWRVMNCWGWATWADRWAYFEKSPEKLVRSWSSEKKYHFDLYGSGVFWPQVERNVSGEINTWAVFWYSTIYEHQGLCLNPSVSYVQNIGNDGSGVNCGSDSSYFLHDLNDSKDVDFSVDRVESSFAVHNVIKFYKKQNRPVWIRAINKIGRLVFGITFIK
ncbi:glycosyltransferase [Pseudomonas sp. MAFF 302030]|uniref:Glycosyltransferase n=1 Tax=Pseudomonas morbosilactucae TaxID=2938197 RepID=A0A9X2C9W3_9PSED|nr:glycosyltransferase [Pseudomonas morbosilactucae]MCK9801668.1 glycosyltransferase [Pseudomonas morbosilactucae]